MTNQEFYIGYVPKAPSKLAWFLRVTIMIIGLGVMVLAFTLVRNQKGFSNSNFEYGKLTDIEGVFVKEPIPMIKMKVGKDLYGSQVIQTLPMVGFGKMGAESVMNVMEEKLGQNLNNKRLRIKGTLIYGDGKALIQVAEEDNPDAQKVLVTNAKDLSPQPIKEMGMVQLKGEILDPKCYFGVMKPGEGKPHKSCAIRCISGGITPVLVTKTRSGNISYYWLLDQNGKAINQQILEYVAEPVAVKGSLKKSDDIELLFVNVKDIKRID
jgi:hypothetical protein